MRLAAATVVLLGCGRIGFEPPVDGGPIGHDEDGDGVGDSMDVCPQLPDPQQQDLDGDGVGDACDRDPTQPGQRLAYFNAMRPEDEDVLENGAGTWTQLADALAFDGDPATFRNGQLTKVMPLGDADIWLGVSVRTRLPGAPDSQVVLALVDVTSANPYYYGGLYQDVVSTTLSVSEWTGSGYRARGTDVVPGDLHTGELELFLGARLSPRQLDVIGGWPGESYNTAALIPNYDGVDRLTLATEGLALEVRYLAIVTTP